MKKTNEFKTWYINIFGKVHRKDGPAIEYRDGSKGWWLNGLLHREDGPAIEWVNGDKIWYINGNKHRVDGPAVEYARGERYWYLNDHKYSQEVWFKKLTPEEQYNYLWNLDK
jgi:hypothetical protein